PPQPVEAPAPPPPKEPTPPPRRSDALLLLETLQREARFLDFVQEEIDSYSDQQIGGAVREVHRGCRAVLQRMFAIQPVLATPEGNPSTVTAEDDAARVRLVGKVVDTRPISGVLVHAGWQAGHCHLPQWTGTAQNERLLAPAEV